MAIYIYQEGEHPGGFAGIRVSIMIGGKVKSKYYSFLKYAKKMGMDCFNQAVQEKAMRDAKKQHAIWKKQQEQSKRKRAEGKAASDNEHFNCKPFRSTGFTGVTMVIYSDTRCFNDRPNSPSYTYYRPGFRVASVTTKKRDTVFI